MERPRSGLGLIAGVLLPLFVVAVEASTGMCARSIFDPLATVWHWIAVLSVPAANLVVWFRRDVKWLDVLMGVGLVSALFYTFAFGPFLLLFSAVMMLFGFGFLVWAAPISGCVLGCAMAGRMRGEGEGVRMVLGCFIGVVILFAGEWPATEARRLAAEQDLSGPVMVWPGVAGALRRQCADRVLWPGELRYWEMGGTPSDWDGACRVLYWVSGERLGKTARENRWWRFDEQQGQTQVGGELPELRIAASHMRVEVDRMVGVEDVDWEMEFSNEANWQQEARMKVLLPPGGAVVGASLWVDGEERQARFGATSVVKAAYQQVAIVQRRDPLLMTWAGREQVFVQAFPVNPKGRMRIRLRIAAPVTGQAVAPKIVERNLALAKDARVEVVGEGSVVHGWAVDRLDRGMMVRVRRDQVAVPRRVQVVIDSSAWMGKHADALRKAVEGWKREAEVKLWFGGQEWAFGGGVDNVPMLEAALKAGGTVVWVHGPQPFVGKSTIGLDRLLQGPAVLWGVRMEEGENRVWAEIEKKRGVRNVGRLRGTLQELAPQDWVWERARVSGEALERGSASTLWASGEAAGVGLKYRVVTAEVGAVVLEKDSQYDEHGLEKGEEKPVSETPEPATFVVVGLGLALFVYLRKGLWRSSSRTVVSGPWPG
jgi:hypothetical protein